jgi:hypothetical protein
MVAWFTNRCPYLRIIAPPMIVRGKALWVQQKMEASGSLPQTAGIIQGSAGPTAVTISVTAQADGRVRVEFNTKGPKGQDKDLNERLVRY